MFNDDQAGLSETLGMPGIHHPIKSYLSTDGWLVGWSIGGLAGWLIDSQQ